MEKVREAGRWAGLYLKAMNEHLFFSSSATDRDMNYGN